MEELDKQFINELLFLEYLFEQDNEEKEKLAQQLIIELSEKDLAHLFVGNDFI